MFSPRKNSSLIFCLFAAAFAPSAMAHAPSGAIFTTVADGSEVNANIYASKELVYLDGGPGPGAPQGAAGLRSPGRKRRGRATAGQGNATGCRPRLPGIRGG